MPRTARSGQPSRIVHAGLFLSAFAGFSFFIILLLPAAGEVLTIVATGEYLMAEKDTPEEAKSRALQEARRLVLERTWASLLSVAELKSLGLSRNDVQEYSRGLIELTEEATQSLREGEAVVVRVDVAARIDPILILRRVNALRQFQSMGD